MEVTRGSGGTGGICGGKTLSFLSGNHTPLVGPICWGCGEARRKGVDGQWLKKKKNRGFLRVGLRKEEGTKRALLWAAGNA